MIPNGKTVGYLLGVLGIAIVAAGGMWVTNLNEDVRRVARAVDEQQPRYEEVARRIVRIEASQDRLSEKFDAFMVKYLDDRVQDRRRSAR
jgi:hypothetical protein